MEQCRSCGAEFNPDKTPPSRFRQLFCSYACWENRNIHRKTRGGSWVEKAGRVNGNMELYLRMLLTRKRHAHKGNFDLTVDQVMALYHAQGGKCALTGRELQCQVVPGIRNPENVSLDRIKAGGPYSIENLQLVCLDVNEFRGASPLKNFVHVCSLVTRRFSTKKRRPS